MTRRSWHRHVGRAARWLGAALALSQAALAGAQSESEIAAAARQLREPGAAIEPLPDSPLTRDVGEIAVIAHDGSSYDRIHEGQPNYLARERVGRRFYETHADQYDFLVVFTNFEFETGGATAFHLYGRNDVEGIGKPVGSVAPVVFGSPARLKGWIDMAALSRYRQRPLSLSPGDPGFLRTLGVLAHEMGHQWLAEARYKVGDSRLRRPARTRTRPTGATSSTPTPRSSTGRAGGTTATAASRRRRSASATRRSTST